MATMSQAWTDYISLQLSEFNETNRTAFYGVVVGINNQTTRSVTVKILNERYTDDGDNMDSANILQIPVMDFRTQTSMLSLPISIGDVGLCVVVDSNTDNFKISQEARPVKVYDNRSKDVQDAVFIPGVYPFPMMSRQANKAKYWEDNNDLKLIHNIGTGQEAAVLMKQDGNIQLKTAMKVSVDAGDIDLTAKSAININAPRMSVNVGNTTWTGSNTITGTWTFNGIPFDTHVHLGVTPGPSTTGLPTA